MQTNDAVEVSEEYSTVVELLDSQFDKGWDAGVQAAFERADANRDGQLSAQEARQLPVISQRFEEIDSDRNGQLSRTEFDKGAQQY